MNKYEESLMVKRFVEFLDKLGVMTTLDSEYRPMTKHFPNMKLKSRIAIMIQGKMNVIKQRERT